MDAMHNLEERRTSKRFWVKEQSSFVSNPNWPDRGTLIDISKGGFAFQYVSDSPWPEGAEGCMLLGNHDSCLGNVPTEVVADRIVDCGPGKAMIVRRRSLKFGDLTAQQKFLLECFIWINSTARC